MLLYEREAKSVDIWLTEVPTQLRGQAIARLLVENSLSSMMDLVLVVNVVVILFLIRDSLVLMDVVFKVDLV